MITLFGKQEEAPLIAKFIAKHKGPLFLSVPSAAGLTFQTNHMGLAHSFLPNVGFPFEIGTTFILGFLLSTLAWIAVFIMVSIGYNLLLAGVIEALVHNCSHHLKALIKHSEAVLIPESVTAFALIFTAVIFGLLLHKRVKSTPQVLVYSAIMGAVYLMITNA